MTGKISDDAVADSSFAVTLATRFAAELAGVNKAPSGSSLLAFMVANLGSAASKNVGTAAGNVPPLDGSGLLDTAVLPALAISDVNVVASQAAMLALTAQKGDIAIRSDLNKSFALSTNSPSTLADWKELLTPTDAVLSVATLTGAITAAALKTALAIAVADITDATANGRSLISAANYAAMQTLLSLVAYNAAQSLTSAQRLQARSNISAALRGQIAGLTLSTAGSSSTFAVATGEAADSTAADLMLLGSGLSKTTGSWAVGNATGSFDGTGAAPSATADWYHVHLIKRPDTGVVDVLTSRSATAPTLPTNYTLFRRIGAMKTNGSFQWIKFIQNGDEFLWDAPVADISNLNVTTTSSALTLTVPTGLIVNALFQGDYTNTANGSPLLLYSPATATQAAGTPSGNWSLNNSGANNYCSNAFNMRTNVSAQINAVCTTSTGASLYIITQGWVDRRGRLD